jgi:hypothetical protein
VKHVANEATDVIAMRKLFDAQLNEVMSGRRNTILRLWIRITIGKYLVN